MTQAVSGNAPAFMAIIKIPVYADDDQHARKLIQPYIDDMRVHVASVEIEPYKGVLGLPPGLSDRAVDGSNG
jgi:hypothetical protein